MPKVKIQRDRCKGCKLCVIYCKSSCIEMDSSLNKRGVRPAKFAEDEKKKCIGCSICVLMCPDNCIIVSK